jgi:iron(II)-dependent oxidoreductase
MSAEKPCILCGSPAKPGENMCPRCLSLLEMPDDVDKVRQELLVGFDQPSSKDAGSKSESKTEGPAGLGDLKSDEDLLLGDVVVGEAWSEGGGGPSAEETEAASEEPDPEQERRSFLAMDLHRLAFTYLNTGRLKEAIGIWERALEIDPDFEEAREHIVCTRKLLKQAHERQRQIEESSRKNSLMSIILLALVILFGIVAIFNREYFSWERLFPPPVATPEPLPPEEFMLAEPRDMVRIEAATFWMGSAGPEQDPEAAPDERPRHQVRLKPYAIDRYEVTIVDFCRFLNEVGNQTTAGKPWFDEENPRTHVMIKDGKFVPEPGYEAHPITCVTWYGADAYASWKGLRLPTEAEWEYAARGPEGFIYPWGNEWKPYLANTLEAKLGDIAATGRFKQDRSPLGVYDLAGNVSEWCADWHQPDYYTEGLVENPKGPASGSFKVVRGGNFAHNGNGDFSRAAHRSFLSPTDSNNWVGFRCAKDLE